MIAAGLLAVLASLVAAAPAPPPAADPALAAMVAQELAQLGVKPKSAILPSDQAFEVTTAIKRGDYGTARRICDDVLSRSQVQPWRFYPFDEFMHGIARGGNDPSLLEHLGTWLEHEPDSAMAHLLRAWYYRQAGWAARSEELPRMIPHAQMSLFVADMGLATREVRMSIKLNPRIPWSYYLLLDVVSGNANSPEMDAAFQTGITAYPGYYELYRLRLFSLTPKWGGSVGAMNAFVEQYAGGVAAGSARKLLYLQLYAYLLDAAWFDCRSLEGDRQQQCINAAMKQTVSATLEDQMRQALSLYKLDPTQFNRVLRPMLDRMVTTVGGGSSQLGALLQLAASTVGSDNRLMHEPGHNNYVLDDIAARVWAQIGNTANAEKKFQEALSDIEHTSFPDEARKDIATAWVYDEMTAVADKNSQFVDIIAYQDASNLVGGRNHGDTPYYKCYAYYRLKHYAAAVQECTSLIENNANYIQSHYWLAKAYAGLEEWDAALAQFGPVADSSYNWFRVGAALDMSYILGRKNDFAGELASLNEHGFLFDGSLQSRADLADSYNNRCFAYMKLGELQKALDDCSNSLKYGQLPDAFMKRQELMQKLGAKPTS
jgi:tetratricopeptide (TPR) repeat protein